ncbi:hypothetical protein SDC9_47059 [bioreactor metagenome]|uniref:Uncharacterized protein n=1 Tax=bioreactor metagenome TaxID=1076179 RepID=A0A644WBC8_9ZZZZ
MDKTRFLLVCILNLCRIVEQVCREGLQPEIWLQQKIVYLMVSNIPCLDKPKLLIRVEIQSKHLRAEALACSCLEDGVHGVLD